MKHTRFSLFHPLWLAAALLAGLMLALTMTSAHALPDGPSDVPGGIEGALKREEEEKSHFFLAWITDVVDKQITTVIQSPCHLKYRGFPTPNGP